MGFNQGLFWHRRDLRIEDNKGLQWALKKCENVIPIFIFDTTITDKLEKNDSRLWFIYKNIDALKKAYQDIGSDLKIFIGNPERLIPSILNELNAEVIFTNSDYEPTAIKRDQTIKDLLVRENKAYFEIRDHVLFEKNELLKSDGNPYQVFTAYANRWKQKLKEEPHRLEIEKSEFNKLKKIEATPVISFESLGFIKNEAFPFPSEIIIDEIIKNYDSNRDFPFLDATSRLGIHLRFGTISIRQLLLKAKTLNETYLNELIWREFYQMIIYHYPQSIDHAFKPAYDAIPWSNDLNDFNAWCEGKTGYPLVDAGMRELNQTGFMHNRVRMVVASFLTKHLLIDWQWGAAYFASKLLDFEMASNIGGWQWAAGCGCDAAPYFRVFNPTLQQQKFDPEFKYIKKWIPEFETPDYPKPMIEHNFARERILATFKKTLQEYGT
jgi:deoxyribodipyrimidine photo-lyase